jgi:hypothetical protein
MKLSFINAASSNCLTEVSKWLSSLYKAILPVVNDLLVSKLQEADVASQTSWSFKDSSGVVEVVNFWNCPNADKLWSLDFSILFLERSIYQSWKLEREFLLGFFEFHHLRGQPLTFKCVW